MMSPKKGKFYVHAISISEPRLGKAVKRILFFFSLLANSLSQFSHKTKKTIKTIKTIKTGGGTQFHALVDEEVLGWT